jgi:hypothetical protein
LARSGDPLAIIVARVRLLLSAKQDCSENGVAAKSPLGSFAQPLPCPLEHVPVVACPAACVKVGEHRFWKIAAGSDGAMRAIKTAIRDRFRKWQGQYQVWCARLDAAMRALETAIRDRFQKWRGPYQAWRARYDEQARQQPACYSLIAVQRATAVAKWLLGLSGAGTVLAFAFYIQSYLSILSIKNDCVSRRFVADANSGAALMARCFCCPGC